MKKYGEISIVEQFAEMGEKINWNKFKGTDHAGRGD